VSAVSATEFDVSLPTLADGGYTVAIGPAVTDAGGASMPAAATATFTLDTRGPRIVSAVPADGISTPLSGFDVTFDGPIDPASFTTGDVTVTGPSGATVGVSSVQQVSPTVYRVAFSRQWQPGTYTLALGPDIRDPAGNRLDQDQDGARGETADDVFTTTATVGRVDLVVSDVTVASTSLESGRYVTLAWTVRNQGDATAVGVWYDVIHVTRVSDGSTVSSEYPWNVTAIAGGGFQRITGRVRIPDGPEGVGNLRFTVTADGWNYLSEWDADNNNSASITASSSLASYPDLVVRGVRIVEPTLSAGGTMTIRWTDFNQGGDSSEIRYWHDMVSVVDVTTGRQLATGYSYGNYVDVPAGGSWAREAAVTLPADFDPATARLAVTVTADVWGYLPEYDADGSLDGNNSLTVLWPPKPDLKISGLTVAEANLFAGGGVTVRWNDDNAGIGDTVHGWTDRIEVVNVTTGETLVDTTLATPALEGGGSRAREYTFTLPANAAGVGELSIRVTADYGEAIAESNAEDTGETNNVSSITRTATAAPDLTISGLTVVETALFVGSTVTVRWNDVNAGSGSTGTGWSDRIVVVNTTTDTTLVDTTLAALVPLAVGGTLPREFAFTLPQGAAGVGELLIRVTADSSDAVAEWNGSGTGETNNVASISRTAIAGSDLTVSGLTLAESVLFAGATVTVRWNDVNHHGRHARGHHAHDGRTARRGRDAGP
jgi:hypothetical protein